MKSAFNLLDEPWLPVRLADGRVEALGLLQLFRRGSEAVALAETAPPSLIAEYRLLLAIVHRALVRSHGTWTDAQRAGWFKHGLPVDEICAYLEAWRHRFWLFDEEHPFLQVAALAKADETRDKRKPWTQVSLGSANGNTPVVFDHALDGEPTAIEPALVLAHLLGFLQFTPGGLVKTLRDADKAGALVNTAAVLPVGPTLAHTLCLALHAPPVPGQPEPDLPAWERPPLTLSQLRGDPVLATGPNDRYTRQSRAVLLEPEPDQRVRWLRFAAGWALGEDANAPDPMACFRAGANGLVRVTFTEGRALWRDLPALVPAPQEGYRAATVVQRAAGLRLVMGGRSSQALLVAGLASDQAKLLRWRFDQILLPQALLVEPARALDLREHVALAETVHQQLRQLASDFVAATLPDPTSKDTRSRARELVDASPVSVTYFAAAERQLWAVMGCIADDQADEAVTLWHRTLREAAESAWGRIVTLRGLSPRALQAEARLGPRLAGALRKHLPGAFAAPERTTTSEEA
jgi:CRISPR system Cascade subunit CasA